MEPVTSTAADPNAMRRSAPWVPIALSLLAAAAPCQGADLVPEESIRKAIAKSLPLMESSAAFSLMQRKCFTCHHVSFPAITANAAWKRGFKIDKANMADQLQRTLKDLSSDVSRFLDGRFPTGKGDQLGHAAWLLKDLGWPVDKTTTDTVRFLVDHDKDAGGWRPNADRPPTVGSPFTTTFVALQALDHYRTPLLGPDIRKRWQAAVDWLKTNPSFDNEDMVFRLRALHLAEDDAFKTEAGKLLDSQHEDGGWAQIIQMNSGPYATGSALAALCDTGILNSDSPEFQRAIRFLLKTQKDDGSWYVQTRVLARQPFYQSLFPYKQDQFISMAATAWATYALLQAIPIVEKRENMTYLGAHPKSAPRIAAAR